MFWRSLTTTNASIYICKCKSTEIVLPLSPVPLVCIHHLPLSAVIKDIIFVVIVFHVSVVAAAVLFGAVAAN